MDSGGQGESVPMPPFPLFRRWTESHKEPTSTRSGNGSSASNNGSSDLLSRELRQPNADFHCGDTLPIIGDHVTWTDSATTFSARRSKLRRTIVAGIVIFLIGGIVGLGLDYYGVWDPCYLKFPYEHHCTTDTYIGGLLRKVDYNENSACLIPGVFHNAHFSGWNAKCGIPEKTS